MTATNMCSNFGSKWDSSLQQVKWKRPSKRERAKFEELWRARLTKRNKKNNEKRKQSLLQK